MEKRKIRSIMIPFAVFVLSFVGIIPFFHSEDENSLLLQNVEALTQNEVFLGMTRIAEDCEYVYTGQSNSTITVVIGGQKVGVTLDKSGNGSYVIKDGQIRCIGNGNGNEACIPQNCH